MQKQKVLIGVGILAVGIIIGIFLFFGRSKTTPTVTQQTTPQAVGESVLVRGDSYQLGDSNAPVTIVEFVDFQCEACAYMHPITQRLLDEYKGKVRFVVRYWPLSDQHKNAQAAVFAAEAAGQCQTGKFWEMYDRLLTRQSQWSGSDEPWSIFVGWAKDLDCDGFPTDFETASNKFAAKVARDKEDAQVLKTNGVPNFFINGNNEGYIQTYDDFKSKIEKSLTGN